jgi:hypothetical protein
LRRARPAVACAAQVERAERFVEQEHSGPVHECARDGDPLLLSAGELAGKPVAKFLQADELERRDPRAGLVVRHPRHLEAERDVVVDGHVREERVGLEDGVDRLRYGGSRSTRLPRIRISPAEGATKPPIRFSVVVLPHPDGPSRQKNSPSSISRSVGVSASCGP